MAMVHMEIEITEKLARTLHAKAKREGVSVSVLVRRELEQKVEPEREPKRRVITEEMRQRAEAVIGKYRDTATDVSVNHDKYYVETILS
jgi:hypothetical protein